MAHAIRRAALTGNLSEFCNKEYNKMRRSSSNPYIKKIIRGEIVLQANSKIIVSQSPDTTKKLYQQEQERSEHIHWNQYVGEQYARQTIDVANTIVANEQRHEYIVTLEVKCDR